MAIKKGWKYISIKFAYITACQSDSECEVWVWGKITHRGGGKSRYTCVLWSTNFWVSLYFTRLLHAYDIPKRS